MKSSNAIRVDSSREWRSKLAIATAGVLFFEALTGLLIYFLPFSIPGQMMVLVHTAMGLLFVASFAWYQVHHWLVYGRHPMTHTVLTG